VVFTVVGPDFERWVESEMNSRNSKLAEQQNLLVDLDPDI
jgi:hypothetical protein